MNIIQKSSPNFDKGRQNTPVDRIVMHWIVGDLAAADATFSKSSSKVSAHYAVGTNEIHQYVKEEDTAWHAGVYAMNLRSIGIEHRGGPDLPIDEGTYKNSADLLKDICKRHGITLDREHVILHREVKSTACPGNLDVDRIIEIAKGDPCSDLQKKIDGLEENLAGVRKSRDEWRRQYDELSAKYEKEVSDKNKTIESQQKQISNLNESLTLATRDKNTLLDQINALEGKIGALESKLQGVSDDREKCREELDNQYENIVKLNDEITELKKKSKNVLKSSTFWEFIKSRF